MALLREWSGLQSGRGDDMTSWGHHHRSGLRSTLALCVWRLGSLLRLVVLVRVVLMVVVKRVRLEGSRLLSLGAVIIRRVTGQIVTL